MERVRTMRFRDRQDARQRLAVRLGRYAHRSDVLALVLATFVVLIGGALAGAQIETYKGAPPAPSPEYAPTPGSRSPGNRPEIEPAPGKPSLVPAPGQIDEGGRVARSGPAILGLSPMTAFLVGLGLVGLLVLFSNILLLNWVELGDTFRLGLTVAKMRANPTIHVTREVEVVEGVGMRVLPREVGTKWARSIGVPQ
jgi:hypothetical protein